MRVRAGAWGARRAISTFVLNGHVEGTVGIKACVFNRQTRVQRLKSVEREPQTASETGKSDDKESYHDVSFPIPQAAR